ncbi:MAG: mechanosensitive ion channel [Muribaculaceae bacterium]|nr:mechanosensitive ion channel [Muribaculaceae bacterium]MDE6192506.1 mechanosensitive ion channel [Muribaculaceae bacterium]
MFKNISFQDAMSKLANMLVSFGFKLVIAIVVFYIGRFIIRKINQLLTNVFDKRHVDLSLKTFMLSFTKILLYFILVVTIIGILGIETSSFLALFASAGVAIGMALSGTLQNFAGGVLILILKPYKVGDYIEAQGFAGTVKEVLMFNTVITTPDNKTIMIPNGVLSTGSINNYSVQPMRRVDWSLSIQYGDDFETASAAIKEILNSDGRVVKDDPSQAVFVGLKELGDSALILTIRAWCHSADYWGLYFDITQRMYAELPQKGVHFPFPQLDVHLVNNA